MRRVSKIALINSESTGPNRRLLFFSAVKLPSQLPAILVQFFEESSKKNHFC